jgi:hypothetical protein
MSKLLYRTLIINPLVFALGRATNFGNAAPDDMTVNAKTFVFA